VDGRSRLWQIGELPVRWFAYAVTQLNFGFGPLNMIRDVHERSEFVRTREYYRADGTKVDSTAVAHSMIRKALKGEILNDLRKNSWARNPSAAAQNSKYAVLLREFEASGGGGSRFGKALARDRSQIVADVRSISSTPSKMRAKLADLVSRWNEVFDAVAALGSYAAFKEQGLTPKEAAAAALELANFRKTGSVMPGVRMFYAFAQPAVMGGVNLLRGLTTKVGAQRFVGYMLGLVALQTLVASLMGEDEELGKSKMDLLDEYTKDRSLPIPIPGTDQIFKMPLGLGMPVLANVVAGRLRGLAMGEETAGQAAGALVSRGVLPAFTVIEDSKLSFADEPVKWVMQSFAPTVAKPFVNVGINRSGMGGKVVQESFQKSDEFKSQQGSPMTPADYKELAQVIESTVKLDLAPEEVREIVRGFSLGVFRDALNYAVENPHKEAFGLETKLPFISSLLTGYNQYATLAEMRLLEDEGMRLAKLRNKYKAEDKGQEITGERELAVLDLYDRWVEEEKALRSAAGKLTRAGVDRDPLGDERTSLRERRQEAQARAVKEFNAIER
jgi:hypothetical protein